MIKSRPVHREWIEDIPVNVRRIAISEYIDPNKFLEFWNIRFGDNPDCFYMQKWANRIRFEKWRLADLESMRALEKVGFMECSDNTNEY